MRFFERKTIVLYQNGDLTENVINWEIFRKNTSKNTINCSFHHEFAYVRNYVHNFKKKPVNKNFEN